MNIRDKLELAENISLVLLGGGLTLVLWYVVNFIMRHTKVAVVVFIGLGCVGLLLMGLAALL